MSDLRTAEKAWAAQPARARRYAAVEFTELARICAMYSRDPHLDTDEQRGERENASALRAAVRLLRAAGKSGGRESHG